MKYYIDTSIWMDIYEDRKGFNGEPLGEYALKLLYNILQSDQTVIISDILIDELQRHYNINEINGMIAPFKRNIEKVIASLSQMDEAKQIALDRGIPKNDVLHTILARDNKFVLITRDKHFRQLLDIWKHYKPEDLIFSR